MSPERWERINRLFFDCAPLAPVGRAALLESACRDDDGLRAEVEALLDADSSADGTGLVPPGSPASLARLLGDEEFVGRNGPASGQRIGRFQLHGLIGKGGTSEVYRATLVDDESPSENGSAPAECAFKLISNHSVTTDGLRRFRTEQRFLASISHPNVAQYVDSGVTDEGLPYLVMELVEGRPIDRYCDENELPVRERVELLLQVCDAVAFVHRSGVFHRDLTAPNILVTPEGVPKLVDFGISKNAAGEVDPVPTAHLTATGAILGTPAYLAPEQASGHSRSADFRTDIYTLGVVLYRLLAGRYPFESAIMANLLDEILNTDPVPPSRTMLGIPRPLDIICLTCLQKDPRRRYVSAEALADDLRRFLDGRPIKAKPVSLVERARRWRRRNPVVAGLLAMLIITLSVGVTVVSVLWRRAVAERNRAEADFKIARAALTGTVDFGGRALSSNDYSRDQLIASLLMARKLVLEVSAHRSDDPELLSSMAYLTLYLARNFEFQEKHSEAHKYGVESLSYWDRLFRQETKDPNVPYHRFQTLVTVARSAEHEGNVEEALRQREQAVAMERELMSVMSQYDYLTMTDCRVGLAKLLVSRGDNARAKAVLDDNLRMLESLSGTADGLILVQPVCYTLATLTSLKLDADGRYVLIGNLERFGSVIRLFSSENDKNKPAEWAERLLGIVESGVEKEVDDANRLARTVPIMIYLFSEISSAQRAGGQLDDARRNADRMLAFGSLLVRRYPGRAAAHLLRSAAYEQFAQNASQAQEHGAVQQNWQLALNEAVTALSPDAVEKGVDDATRLATTVPIILDLFTKISSAQRKSGQLDDARRNADRMLAFGNLLVRRYPGRAAAHLFLSAAYEQLAQNASQAQEQGAVQQNWQLALNEAVTALSPDAVEKGIDDASRLAMTVPIILDLFSKISSVQRNSGQLEDARQNADRMLAFGNLLVRRYPHRAPAHLFLSAAYRQLAKNAWQTQELEAVKLNWQLALDEAVLALSLDPDDKTAQSQVKDIKRRLDELRAPSDAQKHGGYGKITR